MPIIILVKSKSKAHLGFVCARNRRTSKHMEERNHTFCRNYANACGLACFRQRRQSIKRTCKSYLSAIHVLARSTNSRTLSEWKKARDIKYSNRFYSRVIYAFIYFIVIMVIHQFFGWHENALNFFHFIHIRRVCLVKFMRACASTAGMGLDRAAHVYIRNAQGDCRCGNEWMTRALRCQNMKGFSDTAILHGLIKCA